MTHLFNEMPKFHGRQQISTDVISSILEFRLQLFRCRLAIDILDSVNYKQSGFGSVCGADIVSAVQENLKWLKSELHSFQDGGMNTRIYFMQQYVLIHPCKFIYFLLLNFGRCCFSGTEDR